MGSGILYNPIRKQEKQINYQSMAKDKNQIEELKELIDEELKDCSHVHWPHICQLQNTPEGKARLHDLIIRAIAADGMSIGSAIALAEMDLSHIPDGTGL
jgi:K+/H+ antiporter YhaU regulatory subunit KhtT